MPRAIAPGTPSRRISRAAIPPRLSSTMDNANGTIRSPASQAG